MKKILKNWKKFLNESRNLEEARFGPTNLPPEPEVREAAKNNPRYKQYLEDVDRAETKLRDELEDALFD